MPRTGYDSVAGSAAEWLRIVPEKPDYTGVIGSYWNGRYANTTSAKQAFPHATHMQYDVDGSAPGADVLDVEPLDAVPSQAPGWARRHNEQSGLLLPHPAIYCSASNVSQVVTDMLDDGFKRSQFLILSAHYGWTGAPGGQHICGPHTCGYPQADGTQYSDKGLHGQNTDLLLFGDHFFGGNAPDPDARYDLFDDVKRSIIDGRTERATVEEYDKWRATQTRTKHPHRARLYVLRVQLMTLALRLNSVIKHEQHPSANQQWRLRELRDRAAGKRLV